VTRRLLFIVAAAAAALHGHGLADASRRSIALASIVPGSCAPLVDERFAAPGEPASALSVVFTVDAEGGLREAAATGPSASAAFDALQIRWLGTCRFTRGARPAADGSTRGVVVFPRWTPSAAASSDAPPGSKPAVLDIQACAPKADDYPAAALRAGAQGTTSIRFTVDEQGRLAVAEVAASSGNSMLDAVGLQRLMHCRFRAARQADGTPVGATFSLDYRWRLQ
jgi:TonB family protein